MAFSNSTHLITKGSAGISIKDISTALNVSINEYSLRSLAQRTEVNIWSKKKPVSSPNSSALEDKDFLNAKYGLDIPHTSESFTYVNVDDWQSCYRGDWGRAYITDKNYRISDWEYYYTEAKPSITIVDMSTFVDASTAWVMMENGTENYADISVQVPDAYGYQISLSDLQFSLGSGGKESYLSNCHLVALCLCEDTFTENPYVNGIGSGREVSRVFINPKKLTESDGLRVYIPASLSFAQGETNYQNMTVIPMIGVEPMCLPKSSDNATIFYQTTLSDGAVEYEHVRNVPSQLVPIPKTKGGYMAWHYKAPYGANTVPKLFSIINDSNVWWSDDQSVWYGDFGTSATSKHVHLYPYWYTENYSVRTKVVSNGTFYVSCSVFNPNSHIDGITSSSIKYSVNGGTAQQLTAFVDDSFNTVSSISLEHGSSNRIYMKLSNVTLPSDTEIPIRFTADGGDGKYVHIGTLYFRSEVDFVAEMGTDKIKDVSVSVAEIPASGGSVSRADIYYTFDTNRKHYVFTDFLVEAESLGTTYSPANKQLKLVPFTIRDSGQIYEDSFWVEQQPNLVEDEKFIIDYHSIQQFNGDGESDLTEFDSKSHQRAFYIKVLVDGYVKETYTSGSIKNNDMQYGVVKTSDASFEMPINGWTRLGDYIDGNQYIAIDRNTTFYDRTCTLKVKYNSESVSYSYTQKAASLPLIIDRVYVETKINGTVDKINEALFNNSLGAFQTEQTPLFTDKGTYKYNFKLRIRLDSSEFGADNGGAGVDLKGYSIWLEIKKSDGSTYRIYLMLDDTYDHYYISNTEPVDVYFGAYTDESKSDSKIFYQSFSECYDSDGNWIGDGKNIENEVKKKVGWKLYLDTVNGVTPNLTPQMTSDGLHLTSADGSQYFTGV